MWPLRLAAPVTFLLLASAAPACSIPVFRYALERWRPDLFEVLVFHRGAIAEDQQALIERFAPDHEPGEPLPNTLVSRIDLDGQVRPEFEQIWNEEPGESLPWIIVRTPWRGQNETVWSGPLGRESVETVLQSPGRSEIAKRLLEGQSVVFVVLEGTDKERNAEARKLAENKLARLQQEIKLPEIRIEDLQDLTVSPDQLGLKFSILPVDRNDPREAVLVRTMLSLDPKLREDRFARSPMIFPVFGRGRVFFPLVGDDINPVNLEDLARFLCGACQCTVKEQNPGIDILTIVDWDHYIQPTPTGEKPLPPLTGLAGFGGVTPTTSQAALSNSPIRPTVAADQPVVIATDGEPTSSEAGPAGATESASTEGATAGHTDQGGGRGRTAEQGEMPAAPDPPRAGAEQSSIGRIVLFVAGGVVVLVLVLGLISRPRG